MISPPETPREALELYNRTCVLFNALGGPKHDCVDWKTLHNALKAEFDQGRALGLQQATTQLETCLSMETDGDKYGVGWRAAVRWMQLELAALRPTTEPT